MALFRVYTIETHEDGTWIELDSLFYRYYIKKNHNPNDKLKGVRRNLMTKEIEN